MTEQIEVLGQFDVRRDDVASESETELTGPVSYTHLTLPTNREV